MAVYVYRAVDGTGRVIKGNLEADDENDLRAKLKKDALTLTEVREQGLLDKDINLDIGGKPSTRDLAVMCRQFVSMTKAGVSILDAIKMLCEQTENKMLKETLREVRISVEKGETLAGSFAMHPKVFPSIMINMVEAGEASGSLDIALDRVAKQLERSNKTQSRIKKAAIYPIAVFVVAIVVSIVMLVVVIPSYESMFADLGTELPAITKMYVAMSNFLIDYWFIAAPIVVAVIVAIIWFSKTDLGKHIFGKAAITIPMFKNLTVKSASSLMARTLSTLMGSGVPLIEAVTIVAGVMSNVWFKEALQAAAEEIMIGMPLSRPLESCGLFPPMVYHMVRIGEESGNTETMLDQMADYYDEEVEMAVSSLMAAMEPMIIVVLAVVVGGLMAACMAPMMTMYTALDSM